MKKIASLFLMFIVLVSCATDVTRNNPSLQGLKDDVLWRATASFAELASNQHVTITGITQHETLTLDIPNKNPGTYLLGVDVNTKATFVSVTGADTLTYATGTGEGDGEVVIEELDPVQMTITGTFRFNAVNVDDNPLGGPLLNFQYGHFYKVPLTPAL